MLSEVIGPGKDIPAPDVYTTGKEMTQIMDTFSKLNENKYSPGVITGKPISMGGSLANLQMLMRFQILVIRLWRL